MRVTLELEHLTRSALGYEGCIPRTLRVSSSPVLDTVLFSPLKIYTIKWKGVAQRLRKLVARLLASPGSYGFPYSSTVWNRICSINLGRRGKHDYRVYGGCNMFASYGE